MLRAYPQTVDELTWYYEQAPSEVGPLKSTWPAEVRAAAERAAGRDDRPHLVHVPSGQPSCTAPEPNWHAIAAAGRERRIRAALAGADHAARRDPRWTCPAPPSEVLRLRFRELVLPARVPFGLSGQASRRGRPINAAIGIRLNPARGPGSIAHLAPAALEAWGRSRSRLSAPVWVDRLGIRLGPDGGCTAAERELSKVITQQCELLEAQAVTQYRTAIVRVPERVRRAARERDAA
jgi:hypothetical protein